MEGISIIIPTRERLPECEVLFQSIQEAIECAKVHCEVIVVDDSSPAIANKIQHLCYDRGFKLISTNEHNVSAKRNLGWRAAANKIVLFLDSDCIADKYLIIHHLYTYRNNCTAGCLGDLVFDGPQSIFFRATKFTPFAWPFRFATRFAETTWGPTANLSFRKSHLERIGGFDASFPDRPGGEDVDLGLRITANNHPIVCNPEAKVRHSTTTWNTCRNNIKRFFGWGRADYHLIIRHPGKTSIDLPRIPLIFMLLLLGSWIVFAVQNKLLILTLPFLWLGLTTGFSMLLFHCEFANPSYKERFIALIYILVNETGTLYEGAKHRYWPIVAKRMIYGPNQIHGEWHEAGKRLWAQWIAMAICFIIY